MNEIQMKQEILYRIEKQISKKRGLTMAIIKCKMCGGELELVPGKSDADCEYGRQPL